eukprot:6716633-Prorocentrum_lima.AAC.1
MLARVCNRQPVPAHAHHLPLWPDAIPAGFDHTGVEARVSAFTHIIQLGLGSSAPTYVGRMASKGMGHPNRRGR